MKKFITLFILLYVFSPSLKSQTYVGGEISSNTIWFENQSPYIVTDNVLVNINTTLTIQHGVTVKFNEGLSLQINGELIARGTQTNPIVFTSNTTQIPGMWGSIYFNTTSQDAIFTNDIEGEYEIGSIMEYCIIEYAGQPNVSNNGAIRLNGAHPFINFCTIHNNSATGIKAFNLDGILKISNSIIYRNQSNETGDNINAGGVFISGNAVVLIDSVTISYNNASETFFSDNAGGIFVSNSGFTKISNNSIINNSSAKNLNNNSGGIYIDAGGNKEIMNNLISENISDKGTGGIFAQNTHILKNVIYNNSTTGEGGGIKVSNCIVQNNYIIDNSSFENGGGINILYGSDISNNIIANNSSIDGIGGGIFWWGCCVDSIFHNAIIGNSALNSSAVGFDSGMQSFTNNTICNNENTSILNTLNHTLHVKSGFNINQNNIFKNSAFFELYNEDPHGTPDINATDNWWGTTDITSIQNKIYDWFDDTSLGLVSFFPYKLQPDTNAPVSPPTNVSKIELESGNVLVSWDSNPEEDIAGYRLYYGNFNGFKFSDMIDVGNHTSFLLNNFDINQIIGVTAYDFSFDTSLENQYTLISENIVNGNESWYSIAKINCSDFSVVLTPEPASCGTCDDGSIHAAVTGGTPPYTYSWNTNFIQTDSVAYNLLPGTYNVSITDAKGCLINDSATISFSTFLQNDMKKEIVLMPNPANDFFTISLNQITSVKIFNETGKCLKEYSPSYDKNYPVAELRNGIYFVRVENEESVHHFKLLIQK